MRKVEFSSLIRLINSKKKHVVFVAHRTTEKNGDDVRYVPLFGGSNYDSLATELDLVGYLVAEGKRRTITFDPCSQSEGKNTCNLPAQMEVPYLKNDNREIIYENNFLETQVFKRYIERLKERSVEGEAYKKLVKEIETDINAIDSVDKANGYIKKVSEYKHIGNSKAVAREKFSAKIKELGYIYDPASKSYSAPEKEQQSEIVQEAPANTSEDAVQEAKETKKVTKKEKTNGEPAEQA